MATKFIKRVVICGSMSAYNAMLNVRSELAEKEIPSIVPEPEFELHESLAREDFEVFKKNVSFNYLRKIRDPQTFAILAVNLRKHEIDNYIGPNTFAEIAVAFAQSKKVYLLYGIPDHYEDELRAWGVISLQGDLGALVKAYTQARVNSEMQLALFPSLDSDG